MMFMKKLRLFIFAVNVIFICMIISPGYKAENEERHMRNMLLQDNRFASIEEDTIFLRESFWSLDDIYYMYENAEKIRWTQNDFVKKYFTDTLFCQEYFRGTQPQWVQVLDIDADKNIKPDYTIIFGLGQMSSIFEKPVLVSNLTLKTLVLDGNQEKLETFTGENRKIKTEMEEKAAYIKEHTDESMYERVLYDRVDSKICIWLTDMDKSEEFQKEGIVCKQAGCSKEELYHVLKTIWDNKEILNVFYAYIDDIREGISVMGISDEEEFRQKAKSMNLPEIAYHQCIGLGMDTVPFSLPKSFESREQSIDDFMDYSTLIYGEECVKLKTGLEKLKLEYPQYSYANLFWRLLCNSDYERYFNFEKELLEFVNSLPGYRPDEKNPFKEEQYGDPERIELKCILKKYKSVYKDMDYEEIYNKYLLKWLDESPENIGKQVFTIAYMEYKDKDWLKEIPVEDKADFTTIGLIKVLVIIGGVQIFIIILFRFLRNKDKM